MPADATDKTVLWTSSDTSVVSVDENGKVSAIAQGTAIIAATGHTIVNDLARAPSCTVIGLTAGTHCSACGEVFVSQETISALGHVDNN